MNRNQYELRVGWYDKLRDSVKTYVYNYQTSHESSGELVTVKELSQFFDLPEKMIVQVCEDAELNINVAIGVQGMGYYDLEIGEYTVEVLE